MGFTTVLAVMAVLYVAAALLFSANSSGTGTTRGNVSA
jgi:hypothetical protein